MQYFYDVIIGYDENQNPVTEQRTLTIETKVGKCVDDGVPNPTEDEDAYYFGISIDGGAIQYQTFTPGIEGYQPMNEVHAHKYLSEALNQIISNYNAYA